MIEISVVIPTFNRAELLGRCLDALARQTASPETYEVVVVDDGSKDRTSELLASLDPPFRLRAHRQTNVGQAAALNKGISLAQGRFCLLLDDDIQADAGLVAEHLRAQRQRGGIIGLGMLRLRLDGRAGGLGVHFASWWRDHYERLENGTLHPDFGACYSGNLSIPVEPLRHVGGFDERLERSFDVELAYRLQQSGLEIQFLPDASAEQHYSKGFRAIVRDFDRMGTAAVSLYRRHPELLGYPPLGDFNQGSFRTVVLRRALLALRAPVWPIGLVDRFLASRPPARLYAFLQLHCFWRSVRTRLNEPDEWRRLTRGTVVLMYHALGQRGEAADRYVLPLRRFRTQLLWLRLRRYPIISLDEYARSRRQGVLPPARAVVLTFDDGYADTAELGLPLLREAGCPAAVFVVSGMIGETNSWDPGTPLEGRRLLTWTQIADLREAGISIGAHTLSHVRLTERDHDEARREVAESGACLESRLGMPTLHFAYPYGKTSPSVQQLVQKAGYLTACGIRPGPNGSSVPLHDLRRVEIEGTWSLPKFALSVWSGYQPRLKRSL